MEEDVRHKKAEVAAPLKTPGQLKMFSDATSRALFEDTPEPPKVETIKLHVVEDETWLKEGIPSTLVAHLCDIKDTLLQTADTIPGLYRDFSAMHELLANDIDTLQTRVDLVSESQKASRQESTILGDVVSGDATFRSSLDSLAEEVKRISKIAHNASQATAKTSTLQAQVNKLEGQLNLTLQALIDLKQIAPVPKPRVGFETTKMDSVDKDRLSSLEQQVKLLSSKNQVSGTITVFTDLIAGIRTIEDVEAWLLRFYNDVGGDASEDE